MKSKITGCYFIILLFLFPQYGMAEPHKKGSRYIGFGLGGVLDAQYEVDGRTLTFGDWLAGSEKDSKISINLKIGRTITPKTLLGFDITSAHQSGSFGDTEGHIQINNLFIMLTHFPKEVGFFLRGGGGLSDIPVRIEEKSSGNVAKSDEQGYGVLAGVGYAFWLGKSFNLTVNIDHSRQFYPGGVGKPKKSQFTIAYLGFDWY